MTILYSPPRPSPARRVCLPWSFRVALLTVVHRQADHFHPLLLLLFPLYSTGSLSPSVPPALRYVVISLSWLFRSFVNLAPFLLPDPIPFVLFCGFSRSLASTLVTTSYPRLFYSFIFAFRHLVIPLGDISPTPRDILSSSVYLVYLVLFRCRPASSPSARQLRTV